MHECNKESFISIKTAFGQTKRAKVENVEMQGSVLSPIKASASIDTIGKECLQKNENIYKYKNLVNIPPLAMVDDIVGIAHCGQKSVKLNTFINSKIEMKKLWLGENKCHQIHVGNKDLICPDLMVHDKIMKKVACDKYLGSVVYDDCLNKRNIEAKTSKGMGMINQIMILLEELCLGHYYFETAVLLRESMFVNGILFNIEASYGLTKENIIALETLDRILLRKILSVLYFNQAKK